MKWNRAGRAPKAPDVFVKRDAEVHRTVLALLDSARRADERETTARAHELFEASEEARRGESLAAYVYGQAEQLEVLRADIWRKESAYYHTRAGRKTAIAKYSGWLLKINPDQNTEQVSNQAKDELKASKRFAKKFGPHYRREINGLALADWPEFPEVGKVESEAVGFTYVSQSWKLDAHDDGWSVQYIARDENRSEVLEMTEQFRITEGWSDGPEIMHVSSGTAANEKESLFVLGLIVETQAAFEERLRLPKPPGC